MNKLSTFGRVGLGLLATALSAGGTLAAPTGCASAVTVFSKFEVLHSGMVMDVANATSQAPKGQSGSSRSTAGRTSGGPGTSSGSTPAAGSSANTPAFELIARHSGKCLDIKGGIHVTVGFPWCSKLRRHRQSAVVHFHKVADFGLLTGKGYHYIPNLHSGLVIDVANASQAPEVLVQFPHKPLNQAHNHLWNNGIGGVA